MLIDLLRCQNFVYRIVCKRGVINEYIRSCKLHQSPVIVSEYRVLDEDRHQILVRLEIIKLI